MGETAYYHIVPRGTRPHSVDMGAHCFCEPDPIIIEGAPGLRVCVHAGVTSARVVRELRKIRQEIGGTH